MAGLAANTVIGGSAEGSPSYAAASGPGYVSGGGCCGAAGGGAGGVVAAGGGGGMIAGGGASGGAAMGSCAAQVCCDGTGEVTTTGWQYVGQGKGGYSQVATYSYLGQGAGDWERTVSTNYTGWRFKPCCYALPLLLLLLPLLWTLSTFKKDGQGDFAGNSEETRVHIKTLPPKPTQPPINCLDTAGWDHTKQVYCCNKFKIGCPETSPPTPKPTAPPVPTTTPKPTPKPDPFECESGIANWGSWAKDKKDWCCDKKHIGCQPPPTAAPKTPAPPTTTPSTSLPFDCAADWTTCYSCLQHRWSVAKRAWCCDHGGRGCTTTAPQPDVTTPPATTSAPYDCAADWTTCYKCLEHRWSVAKRAWCCDHGGRGCTTTAPPAETTKKPAAPTSAPYDCEADYTTCHHCLEKRWSISKRNWCCTNEHKGCHAFPGKR